MSEKESTHNKKKRKNTQPPKERKLKEDFEGKSLLDGNDDGE